MRRRLYFLLPDVETARQTANELLLARVEDRHMRFLAKRGTDLGELHEASYVQKTDLMHGAAIGLGLGGVAGLLLGLVIMTYPPAGTNPQLVVVLIAAIVGAVLGAWSSSMVAAAVPNSRLKQFQGEIANGKVGRGESGSSGCGGHEVKSRVGSCGTMLVNDTSTHLDVLMDYERFHASSTAFSFSSERARRLVARGDLRAIAGRFPSFAGTFLVPAGKLWESAGMSKSEPARLERLPGVSKSLPDTFEFLPDGINSLP